MKETRARSLFVVFLGLLAGLGYVLGIALAGSSGLGQDRPPAQTSMPSEKTESHGPSSRVASDRVEASGAPAMESQAPDAHTPFVLDLERVSTPSGDLELRLAVLDMGLQEVQELWGLLQDSIDYRDPEDFRRASAVLSRLAELDSDAALDAINDAGPAKYSVVASLVSGWARSDLDGALDWITSDADPRMRQGAFAAVLDELGRNDRAAALSLYERAVEDGRLEQDDWNMSRFFLGWAKSAPEEAMARALRVEEATGNKTAVSGVLSFWADSAPTEGLTWIRDHLSGDGRTDAMRTLLSTWSESAPNLVAEFIAGAPERDSLRSELWTALGGWSDTDFGAASGWVDAMTDTEFRDAARAELIRHAEHPFDSSSFRYALEHLDRPGMFEAVRSHAKRLAEADPEEALAWAQENLENPRQRDDFVTDVFEVWGEQLPGDAAARLDELPAGERRFALGEHVARRWALTDAEAAREWVETLPPGGEREQATAGFVEGWLEKDIPAAGRWIRSQPAGGARDALFQREARTRMRHDPDGAVAAARRIDDPFVRELAFETIFKQWYQDRSKAAVARAYINQSPDISETVRWRILNRKWDMP